MILSFILLAFQFNSNFCDDLTVKFVTEFFSTRNTMVTSYFCWDYEDTKVLLNNLSNLHKLTAVYNNSTDLDSFFGYLSTHNYYLLDLNNCINSWKLLKRANALNLFRYPLKWLLLINQIDFEELSKSLRKYSIFPASDVLVAIRNHSDYLLLQPYRLDPTTDIIWENYGFWSQQHNLQETLRNIPLSQRRSNLKQISMNISVVIKNPDTWNHLEDFRYLKVDMFIKQNWIAVKCLLEYCNVNYTLLSSEDYGYFNKTTAKWSGIVGDLTENKTQLSASAVLINRERLEAVDFLAMINPSSVRFVLRKPPLSYISNIFFLPFYWTVWISIFVVLFLFGFVLYFILNWETKYKEKINFQDKFGLKDIFLIAFEILCQQGTMTETYSIAGRIIYSIFLMGFMFLYVAYSANIISLLQTTTEITSVEQLLNKRMSVGAQDVYYMNHYLTTSTEKIKQELYCAKIGPNGYYSLEDGTEKVRQGFFAFHMEVGTGYYEILKQFTDYEVCTLQELEGYAKSTGGYSCSPKNSPYKEIIKVGYLKVEEYGLRRRNYYRVFKKPKCYSKGASFESVGIMDVYPAIVLCLYGLALSIFILIFEIMLKYLNRVSTKTDK